MSADMALLRECMDRTHPHEGYPMVLALVDETGRDIPDPDAEQAAAGAAVAAAHDALRAGIIPSSRDDDLPAYIIVTMAASYQDFGVPVGPIGATE